MKRGMKEKPCTVTRGLPHYYIIGDSMKNYRRLLKLKREWDHKTPSKSRSMLLAQYERLYNRVYRRK